jgi:outer membrane usher protein FimD/PapC
MAATIFLLQPVNKPIDPGNYTVQVFVNGNPAKQTNFNVQ